MFFLFICFDFSSRTSRLARGALSIAKRGNFIFTGEIACQSSRRKSGVKFAKSEKGARTEPPSQGRVVGRPETGHKTDSRKSLGLVTPATGERVIGRATWVFRFQVTRSDGSRLEHKKALGLVTTIGPKDVPTLCTHGEGNIPEVQIFEARYPAR